MWREDIGKLNWPSRLNGYALRKLLNYIRTTYNNKSVMVTSLGNADCGTLKDEKKISYIKEYTNNIMKNYCGFTLE